MGDWRGPDRRSARARVPFPWEKRWPGSPAAATLLSGENDRPSPDEPGALPGGVSAEKGGEMEAGLLTGLNKYSFLGLFRIDSGKGKWDLGGPI